MELNKKDYYNGNSALRKAGVPVQMTSDNVIEYGKCLEDVHYFIDNYCKTISVDHGVVPFKLFGYQRRFIDTLVNNRFQICKLFRQGGKSTVSAAVLLHHIVFNNTKNVAILANKAAQAREVLSRLQMMFEYLPQWLKPGVKTWNKGDIELENGSKAFAAATSPNSIRGRSITWLYLDEFAFVDPNKAEDFFVSSYPTVTSGKETKITITSTPNGYNLFWKFWDGAEKGTNGFVPFEAHYSEKPGNDEAWAAQQLAVLKELKFNQEVLMIFNGSSSSLIPGQILSRIPTLANIFSNEGVDIMLPPEKDHSYVTLVDVSRGLLGDFSTAVIVDISEIPYRVCAKYKSNSITPLLFPSIIKRLSDDYNKSACLIELNDAGEQVASILFNDLEYENIIFTYTDRSKQLPTLTDGKGHRPGVVMSKSVKSLGCSQLKILVQENKLLINDPDIVAELSTFIENRGSYAADVGYHDDLVMPLVSFGWFSSTELFKHLTDVNLRDVIYRTRENDISNNLTPYGFRDDGTSPTYRDVDGFIWVAKGDIESREELLEKIKADYGFDEEFSNWFYEKQ